MKRNISINISGIIFYIEEDCYDTLSGYLDAITKYFSTYEDSREIIEDIEGRIAEIFYAKLGKNKEVITSEDVEELMTVMGSVDDFQAVEDDPAYEITYESESDSASSSLEIPTEDDFGEGGSVVHVAKKTILVDETLYEEVREEKDYQRPVYTKGAYEEKTENTEETRRLYRDTKRKIVGGVAAGLAHYMGIDAIWVRLFFVFLLPSGFLFLPAAPQAAIVLYFILWIAVPKNDHLEDNPHVKKLFRDPERGVLGGVARGLSAYLGANEMLIRILFILITVFYGSGIFLYLLLWMFVPEAKTLTEKMEMEGQPVNLQNIRDMILKNLAIEKGQEITFFNKVILFPFRLLSLVLDKVTKFLKPVVSFIAETIRLGGGVLLLIISTGASIALLTMLFLVLGWGVEWIIMNAENLEDVPVELIRRSFAYNGWMTASIFTSAFIPAVSLGVFGVMMLTRRIIWNHKFGWALGGLWLISLMGTGVSAAVLAKEFDSTATVEETEYYSVPAQSLTFSLNHVKDSYFRKPYLKLKGYKGDQIKLVKTFKAKGSTRHEARTNAQMIEYGFAHEDSLWYFDDGVTFKPEAKYRDQHLYLTMYIPYEESFKMTSDFRDILYNTIHRNAYEEDDLRGEHTWKFSKGGLVCLECEPKTKEPATTVEKNISSEDLNFSGYKNVEIEGLFDFKIRKGESYHCVVSGEDWKEIVRIRQDGTTLKISLPQDVKFPKGRPTIEMTLPLLKFIEIQGNCKGELLDFVQPFMSVDLSGASRVKMTGQVTNLEVEAHGASVVEAFDMKVQKAEIEAHGSNHIDLQTSHFLQVEAHGASHVRYMGNPKLDSEVSAASSVQHYK